MRLPHPALRPLVSRYVGYRQSGVTLAVHRGLPSEHVSLVISLAAPIRLVGMPGSEQRPDQWRGFVGGLHTSPALVAQDHEQAGVHLFLNPLGVRALLGVSARELASRVVGLAELPRPVLADLPERLCHTDGWRHRFGLIDEALLASVTEFPAGRGEVDWAWRRILRTGGAVAVGRLAEDVGWSRRHFGQRFAEEVGLSPKQAARVVRFGRASGLLRQAPRVGLAEVAASCGYYDQAHLSNEFRALAGCSPGTWIAEELPFLQDGSVAGASS